MHLSGSWRFCYRVVAPNKVLLPDTVPNLLARNEKWRRFSPKSVRSHRRSRTSWGFTEHRLNKWKEENANTWHDALGLQGTKFSSQTTSFLPQSETPELWIAFLEETVLNRTSPICSCSGHQQVTGPNGVWSHSVSPFYTTWGVMKNDQPPCHREAKVDAIYTGATTATQVHRMRWGNPLKSSISALGRIGL